MKSNQIQRILKHLQTIILLLQPNLNRIVYLYLLKSLPHIIPRISIIQIVYLIDILYALAGHLQNGKDKSFVACSLVELSMGVPEVLFLDHQEELCPEGSEMAEFLDDLPVILFLDGKCGIGL